MDKEELIKNIQEKLETNQKEILNIINNEIKEKKTEDLVLTSFWEIFHNDKNLIRKIVIPDIQRNYVQGNDEKIRKKLVKDIFEALTSENKSVNLDIIYGINTGDTFIPIDGQQRLTTLFLLYWYIFLKDKQNGIDLLNEIDITYENRVSSKEFFELLKDEDIVRKISCNKEEKKISKKIQDCTNYYNSKWSKDVTIQSSLKMLDQIEELYEEYVKDENKEISTILTNTKEPRIYFRCKFLRTEEDNVAELYIKMNSRGKKLSEYEILKSQLENIAFLYKDNTEYMKLCSNFDNNWADIFLHKVMNDEDDITKYSILEKVENNYYNFLKKFIMFYFIDNSLELKNEYEEDKYENIMKSFKKDLIDGLSIKFEEHGIYSLKEDFFDKLENIMNNIEFLYSNTPADGYNNIKEIMNLEALWKINIEEKERKLREELYLYALIKYLENNKFTKDLKENYELFENWIRVTRNYINSNYHIQIADQKKNDSIYLKIVGNIKILITKLANSQNHDIVDLVKNNLDENSLNLSENEKLWLKTEKIKADYMTRQNLEWKDLIIEADKDRYFKGVNYFLFDFIKDEKDEMESFRKYLKVTSAIFKNEVRNNKYEQENEYDVSNKISEFLLQRAMLTKEVYFDETFYVFNHSDNTNTWIFVLNEKKPKEDTGILYKFKKFLDEYIIGDSMTQNIDVIAKLNDIIKNNQLSNKDWRYYFVREPRLFAECNQGMIEFEEDEKTDELDANKRINLIKSQKNSKHWDYLTMLLKYRLDDLKLKDTVIKYIGKTGSREYFKYEENLKIIFDNKEYTFIRSIDGDFVVNIKENDEIFFSFNYDIRIDGNRLQENEFNLLNELLKGRGSIEILACTK